MLCLFFAVFNVRQRHIAYLELCAGSSKQLIHDRALYLKQMWYEIHAPSIDSCWCMKSNCAKLNRTQTHARRLYAHFKGAIPEGRELHHKCENNWCVNPKHLEVLTFSEHLRVHNKQQHVSNRAQNKYQRLLRELSENKPEFKS